MHVSPEIGATRPVIVVVDDHKDTRELYADALMYAGFDVLTASDAEEGFTLSAHASPAVVVTDYRLGAGMSGAELCSRLHQDPRTTGIPTLMVTGASQRNDAESGITAGCAVVRLKPYLPDALERDVRALIAGEQIPKLPAEHARNGLN